MIGGGQGNSATVARATVGGGFANIAGAESATIGGGHANRASQAWATVGGRFFNRAEGRYATVAGGGPSDPNNAADTRNNVADDYGTIGGGGNNLAGDDDGDPTNQPFATVGGGRDNTARSFASTVGGGSGNTAGQAATIGGGLGNTSTFFGTVAGGQSNEAGNYGFVGGGSGNKATGFASMVPGGSSNQAHGPTSFAAGKRAKVFANHEGAFVWGDSTNADINSFGANTFTVRASGGTRIYSNAAATVGVELRANDNQWLATSDRNKKENITPVEPRETLTRLLEVPISAYNFIGGDPTIKIMGPMAQDFHAAFGLGDSDTQIGMVDAMGVTMAAVQGLHEIVLEKQARIDALQREFDLLRTDRDKNRAQAASLEALVGQLADRGEQK